MKKIGTKIGEGSKDLRITHQHGPAIIVTFDPELSALSHWAFTGHMTDVPDVLNH